MVDLDRIAQRGRLWNNSLWEDHGCRKCISPVMTQPWGRPPKVHDLWPDVGEMKDRLDSMSQVP